MKTLIESFIRETLGEDQLIFYENQTPKDVQGKTWIRVRIRVFTYIYNTINLTTKEGTGSLNIDVFTPLNTGNKESSVINDKIINAFAECPSLVSEDASIHLLFRNGMTNTDNAQENGFYRESLATVFKIYSDV